MFRKSYKYGGPDEPILSTIHNPQSTIYNLQSTIHNLQSTIYNLQSTIHNLQSTVHNPQSTLCNVRSTIHNPHCAMCDWQSTIHIVQSTIYIVQCSMIHDVWAAMHAQSWQRKWTSDDCRIIVLVEVRTGNGFQLCIISKTPAQEPWALCIYQCSEGPAEEL